MVLKTSMRDGQEYTECEGGGRGVKKEMFHV